MSSRGRVVIVVLVLVVVLLAGTVAFLALGRDDAAAGPSATAPTTAQSASPSRTPTPKPSPTKADPLAGWTLEQKVGQLFMVGIDLTKPQQVSTDAVRDDHVGNVFLHGRATGGAAAVKPVVDSMTSLVSQATTHGTPMYVATDQEGGQVQALQGPGFSTIPDAMTQATWPAGDLQTKATTWGAQLADVGVNLDLAPVMDLVPDAATAAKNPPIGQLRRNYGYTPDSVTSHAQAFSAGLAASGVQVSIKHFPGLGRVTENTDTTANVTDDVTTRDDASVQVFASGIAAGAPLVMVSTAIYAQIDPSTPAAFSSTVVTGMLRHDLHFDGLVITDDLSGAKQVAAWAPGERAIQSIEAGVDLVLVSKDPEVTHAMVSAVVERAQSDPAFAAKVDAAAERVVAAKHSLG